MKNDLTKVLKASVKNARNGNRKRSTTPVDLPEGVKLRKDGNFILPKKPGELADLLYTTKNLRYEVQHRVDRLQKLQTAIETWFINNLDADAATGVAGHKALAKIERKLIPQCEDWDALYAFIARNKAWELLQKRLGETAVKERLDAGQDLPGITIFQAKKVSVTKL